MNQNFADYAGDLRLDIGTSYWSDLRIAIHTEWQRAGYEEEQSGRANRKNQHASALFHSHEFALADQHGFQNRNEGNFLVHLRVAERYGGLAGKHIQNFEMHDPEKIRIAALQSQQPDAPGVIIQGPCVETTHPRSGEVFLEFGARFLSLPLNLLAVLLHMDDFFR